MREGFNLPHFKLPTRHPPIQEPSIFLSLSIWAISL
jgi:hypothetical protein